MTIVADRDHARVRPPDRTLMQRMDALHNANRIRSNRAELKRDLKAGRRTLGAVLADVEAGRAPDLETMKLNDLLVAAPKLGRTKANTILQRARISPSKTLGGLSHRQRAELLRALWTFPVLRPAVRVRPYRPGLTPRQEAPSAHNGPDAGRNPEVSRRQP